MRESSAQEQLKRAHDEASQLVVESGSLRQALWNEQEQRTAAEEATRKAEAQAKSIEEQVKQTEERLREQEDQVRHAGNTAKTMEAQVRSLEEHTPENIRAIVKKIVDSVVADGQLDESTVTMRELTSFIGSSSDKEPFLPAVYYALVDGVWYASLQEQPVKDMIDRSAERQKQPADAKAAEARQVNSALYVSPAAAVQSRS